MAYDYRREMRDDVREAVMDWFRYNDIDMYQGEITQYEDSIYDDLWITDSVTGNASGSYTFSTYQAEENLCHNMDLAAEAYEEFGYDGIPSKDIENPEAMDVTIRCYLLGQVLHEVLQEIDDELEWRPEEVDDEDWLADDDDSDEWVIDLAEKL